MIAEPLVVAPLNVTVAWLSLAAAVTVVGAVGRPAGVTGFDDGDVFTNCGIQSSEDNYFYPCCRHVKLNHLESI